MGLFSFLFSGGEPESQESQLLRQYATGFEAQGLNPHDAAEASKGMLKNAKAEVVSRGWSTQPEKYGDVLLSQEATNPQVQISLQRIREEGVRDEDFRWWWNMSPLERVLMEKADELNRITLFSFLRSKGHDAKESAKKVFSLHPMFGDPLDGEGEDRPLPIELKLRIIQYLERHYASPDAMRQNCERSTSFNALVREEIRNGRI